MKEQRQFSCLKSREVVGGKKEKKSLVCQHELSLPELWGQRSRRSNWDVKHRQTVKGLKCNSVSSTLSRVLSMLLRWWWSLWIWCEVCSWRWRWWHRPLGPETPHTRPVGQGTGPGHIHWRERLISWHRMNIFKKSKIKFVFIPHICISWSVENVAFTALLEFEAVFL